MGADRAVSYKRERTTVGEGVISGVGVTSGIGEDVITGEGVTAGVSGV